MRFVVQEVRDSSPTPFLSKTSDERENNLSFQKVSSWGRLKDNIEKPILIRCQGGDLNSGRLRHSNRVDRTSSVLSRYPVPWDNGSVSVQDDSPFYPLYR